MLFANLILFLIVFAFNSIDAVDYTRLVSWERRTLYCEKSQNQISSGSCYLTVGKDGDPKPALCSREIVQNKTGEEELRFTCDIECKNADRDSVVSKYPNTNRNCIRFFSYNTKFDEKDSRWSIWRTGQCALDQISLEVHCGFPSDH